VIWPHGPWQWRLGRGRRPPTPCGRPRPRREQWPGLESTPRPPAPFSAPTRASSSTVRAVGTVAAAAAGLAATLAEEQEEEAAAAMVRMTAAEVVRRRLRRRRRRRRRRHLRVMEGCGPWTARRQASGRREAAASPDSADSEDSMRRIGRRPRPLSREIAHLRVAASRCRRAIEALARGTGPK
jgi:hypothetical protein